MNDSADPLSGVDDEPHRRSMLAVLMALDGSGYTTQRNIANQAGVALGLANALIKRCVRKGLIKISQAPARRYVYYLTPEGFAEKARLTAEYLSSSLDFFRQARGEYSRLLKICAGQGWHRVALAGGGELAEIALLSAQGGGFTFTIVDADQTGPLHGWPVVPDFDAAETVDAVILSDAKNPVGRYQALLARFEADRVLVPAFLHLSPRPVREARS